MLDVGESINLVVRRHGWRLEEKKSTEIEWKLKNGLRLEKKKSQIIDNLERVERLRDEDEIKWDWKMVFIEVGKGRAGAFEGRSLVTRRKHRIFCRLYDLKPDLKINFIDTRNIRLIEIFDTLTR